MINVLVADDSSFMRNAIERTLDSDPEILVIGFAGNGSEAVSSAEELRPDVIIMDIEMPVIDGIQALSRILEESSVPVILLVPRDDSGALMTLKALEGGAVDFICKENTFASRPLAVIGRKLIGKVRTAARCRLDLHLAQIKSFSRAEPAAGPHRRAHLFGNDYPENRVVAIGASTGGSTALKRILAGLPGDFPAGILVVQHMPAVFTANLAESLDSLCKITVKEAEHGDLVEPGIALIAPGDRHMTVRRDDREIFVSLSKSPQHSLHRPSIDVMVTSVADVYRGAAIGIMLSGSGQDGLAGMELLSQNGGSVIAQDAETALVGDMPGAVIDAGLADIVAPPDRIQAAITELQSIATV